MMFNWDDSDQVGETIWGEFNGSEDHIVPYPKDTEDNQVFSFGDCSKKQRDDDTSVIPKSTGPNSGTRNEFSGCNLKNRSNLNANEDYSAPRLEIDPWPDLPSLNAELGTGYNTVNNQDSFESRLMNKMSASGTVQLDGQSVPFGSAHENKESDSFLDCDWANIGDFADLDHIFRNETIFSHDAITNVDELLSSTADMIGSAMQSIPMPDITLIKELVEHSGDKRKIENNQDAMKKKLLKSHTKNEERGKNKASRVFNAPWPENIGQNHQFLGQNAHPLVVNPSTAISSPSCPQQSKIGLMRSIGSTSQFIYPQYGHPAYPFHGIPVVQQVQADNNIRNEVAVGTYPDPQEYSNDSNMVPELQTKQSTMTPQEKIEKLRRRQQAQALFAIQQQQQQFGHQFTGSEEMAPQDILQRNKGHGDVISDTSFEQNGNMVPPSGQNLLVEHDSSERISTLTDDNSERTIYYYQLQNSLRKLDITVRLCIRDSLFRLARSSMERQNTSDGSSTNKSTRDEHKVPVYEELYSGNGLHMRLPDAEIYTNSIDRAVAQLLFQRPLESSTRPINNDLPRPPILHGPVTEMPINIHETMPEEEPGHLGKMNMLPPDSK